MTGNLAVDWSRLGRRTVIGGMLVVAVVQLILVTRGTQYGFDFRGGTWQAAHALLAGRSPYPSPTSANLLHIANGFITPPLLAVIGVPFALLPFTVAAVLWNVLCTACLAAALRLLGLRDARLYVLAMCSFPFVSSLALGQPDGLFALLAAVAWRYRDSPRGAVAGGLLIAAKLFAWPLLPWLIVTRRFRMAAITAATAVASLAASWASIGFKGLTTYPRLLEAETRAYGPRSHSFLAAVSRLGASLTLAELLTILIAFTVAAAIVISSRGRDEGWFTAAIALGLLLSPVMWQHYLVLLFVPLVILRRFRDPVMWVLVAALWLSPVESPPTVWQTWLVPVIAAVIAIRAVSPNALRSPSIPARAQAPSQA